MKVYKLFNKDMTCRGYQFRKGLNTCEAANCRQNGFHAAENPLDCLSYYRWEESVCWVCNAGGDIDEDDVDSKVSCTELTLMLQLDLEDFIVEAVRYMISHPRRPYRQRTGTITVAKDSAAVPEAGRAVIIRGTDPHVQGQDGIWVEAPDGAVTALVWESRDGKEVTRAEVWNGGTPKWTWPPYPYTRKEGVPC